MTFAIRPFTLFASKVLESDGAAVDSPHHPRFDNSSFQMLCYVPLFSYTTLSRTIM
jgi:hypothetical protein